MCTTRGNAKKLAPPPPSAPLAPSTSLPPPPLPLVQRSFSPVISSAASSSPLPLLFFGFTGARASHVEMSRENLRPSLCSLHLKGASASSTQYFCGARARFTCASVRELLLRFRCEDIYQRGRFQSFTCRRWSKREEVKSGPPSQGSSRVKGSPTSQVSSLVSLVYFALVEAVYNMWHFGRGVLQTCLHVLHRSVKGVEAQFRLEFWMLQTPRFSGGEVLAVRI